MQIADKKVVSVTYTLKLDNESGNTLEEVKQDAPLQFLYGSGNLLPKFEENLSGLNPGDTFEFKLNSEEAYGEASDDKVVDVPKEVFVVDGKLDEKLLQIGNTVPMMDKNGNRLNGTVAEIKDDAVVMDFNHPLAGDSLFFTGAVTEVRDATEEELSHGHVHQHGGGGCEDCNDEGGCGGGCH